MKFFKIVILFYLASCSVSKQRSTFNITDKEAEQGIQEALKQGISRAAAILNKPDAFYGKQYRVGFPPEAVKIDTIFRNMGMAPMIDRAEQQLNRAAEDASASSISIFDNAIDKMAIQDPLKLLKLKGHSATDYLKSKETNQLTIAMIPVVKNALDKFSALKYFNEILETYNGYPTTTIKVNPDLVSYVTSRIIADIFNETAKEEENIRNNPKARKSEMVRKSFRWANEQ